MAAGAADVLATISSRAGGWSLRRLAMLVAALAGGPVYMLVVGGRDTNSVEYITQPVSSGPLEVAVIATGTLQPTAQIAVGSEVSGLIREVLVDFNDTVFRGQILALIDTEQLQARVDSAQASLKVAQAAYVQAQATAEEAQARAARSVDLAQQNIRSRQDLEADVVAAKRSAAEVDSAAAQVSSARGLLQDAESGLRKAVIRSPIDGIVLARNADPGQSIAAAFEVPVLFTLSRTLDEMLLRLDVDESDIGQVRAGQAAKFRVDAYPARVFDARIVTVRLSPRTVNNVVAYETILSVANPELLLRPGMTATAEILVAAKSNVLRVPSRALRFVPPDMATASAGPSAAASNQESRVWLQGASGPVAATVAIGLSNSDFAEVLGGQIKAGDAVIVDITRAGQRQSPGGLF